ncbi:MAG: gliding motility-associated-like protein [Bacteroidia bacterium]|jgi:gliding motility-associated-like protein
MSNPFNDKIKESLENFEMPYDANAWAEFEKQLPQSGGAATGGSQLGWKAVALVAALATSVATIWYLNSDKEGVISDSAVVEQVETTQEQSPSVEENRSELSEPIVLEKNSTKVSVSEKQQIANSETTIDNEVQSAIDNKTVGSEEMAKAADSEIQNLDKKTLPPADKPAHKKANVQPLIASFIPSSIKVCVGDGVRFINESSDLKAKMAWDFGDGGSSDELNPSHSFMASGNYEVTLRTERDSKSADRMVNVTVNPTPVTDIDATLVKEGYEAIPFYRFETVLKPNEAAFWSFTDGSKAQTAVVNHLFRNAGKSEATLTVKNSFGCSVSDTWKTENRKPFDFFAPTGFSPDGDGNNDAFMPGALADMGVSFGMVILDQKGQEVFRTSSSSEPWNGKANNNGRKLDAGIYVWTVVLKKEIVTKKTFSGTITLLR